MYLCSLFKIYTMKKFKRHKDYGFWDQDIRLSKLSDLGDPLEKLNNGIDFEMFRGLLEEKLSKAPQGSSGRPPYDYVLMFKILILQRYYNLSDGQVEFQINDRMSFMRFPDLSMADDIPDCKTVWHFREQLTDPDLMDELFSLFLKELGKLHLTVNEGKIIDASFVEASRQRNTRAENAQIKAGEGDSLWNDKPHRKRQKDIDAHWTQKNEVDYYGYKNHVKQDARSKLITDCWVTDASVHDSNATDVLLNENDRGEEFYADSAYSGAPQEEIIEDRGMINRV